MLDQPQSQSQAKLLAELPLRLHHHAYAVKDQEANRHFIEDILGIPLVATWCERVFRPEVGREVDYCHTFFEMADGGALAFFQFADDEAWEKNRAILQDVGGSWHVAFKVTQASFDELMRRVRAADVPVRKIDHGYCVSMYLKTPDGLRLGQRVRHQKFGDGVVLNFEGHGSSAKVQINFERQGTKWLMVGYANLEAV